MGNVGFPFFLLLAIARPRPLRERPAANSGLDCRLCPRGGKEMRCIASLQEHTRQALLSEPLIFLMNRMALIPNGRLDRVGGLIGLEMIVVPFLSEPLIFLMNQMALIRDGDLNGWGFNWS